MNQVITARLIFFLFALGLWLLAWSLRFLPRHRVESEFRKGIIKCALGAIVLAHLIAEISIYKFLTGSDSLKNDNFFFVAILMQSIIGFGIVVNSESVVRKKEARAGR